MNSKILYRLLLCWFVFTTTAEPAFAQTPAGKRVEERLLAQARDNIERYRKGDGVLSFTDSLGKPVQGKVEINQQTQDFLFGNLSEEIFDKRLSAVEQKKFRDRFVALFNFTELTIKWTGYEKQQGRPEWERFQQKLDWCRQNGITPKGHTLGWTNMSGTPKWLLQLPHTMAGDLYKARIYDLVGGFSKQVHMWDVVNEPVTTIPWERALQDSIFGESKIDAGSRYDTKGITVDEIIPWVARSYTWAQEANPNGDFIINEFNLIAKPSVRQKLFDLVKALQQRGIPVKGIGIQAHEPRDWWFSPVDIVATFNKFDSLHLPLHITEFIPQSSGEPINGGWREGEWTEDAQAEFAEQFYTLAFGHPSVASIHWWGLTDKMIWLKGGGLLDKDLDPKPVYNRLMKLIKQDWMTKNLLLPTDKKGRVAFRGFFGDYTVTVMEKNGSRRSFTIHLGEKAKNEWSFIL